jgi:hypothetical protein
MKRALLATTRDLSSMNQNIAAVCFERTRSQREQHGFRQYVGDVKHDQWETELQGIEERRKELVQQQTLIMKRSRECGVGGVCI